jgi:hypothetical protein
MGLVSRGSRVTVQCFILRYLFHALLIRKTLCSTYSSKFRLRLVRRYYEFQDSQGSFRPHALGLSCSLADMWAFPSSALHHQRRVFFLCVARAIVLFDTLYRSVQKNSKMRGIMGPRSLLKRLSSVTLSSHSAMSIYY